MKREELERSWAITRQHLEAAKRLLSQSALPSEEGWSLANYEDWFAHNELALGFEELEGLGNEGKPGARFWREMLAAAENMGLSEKAELCRQQIADADKSS